MGTKSTNVQGFAPTGREPVLCGGCYLCEVELAELEAEAAVRAAIARARLESARARILAAQDEAVAGI